GRVGVACISGAVGFVGAAFITSPVLSMTMITVAAMGVLSRNAPFWAIPSMFLTGEAAAGGLALVNTVGALGGFVGPYIVGYVRDATGSFSGGLFTLAIAVGGGGLLLWPLRHHQVLKPVVAEPAQTR